MSEETYRLEANRVRIQRWREEGLPQGRVEEVLEDLRGLVRDGPGPRWEDETVEEYTGRVSSWYRITKGLIRYGEEALKTYR